MNIAMNVMHSLTNITVLHTIQKNTSTVASNERFVNFLSAGYV